MSPKFITYIAALVAGLISVHQLVSGHNAGTLFVVLFAVVVAIAGYETYELTKNALATCVLYFASAMLLLWAFFRSITWRNILGVIFAALAYFLWHAARSQASRTAA